jgi:phosphoglycolate phosphatase-like HAD superfamily hydrolase
MSGAPGDGKSHLAVASSKPSSNTEIAFAAFHTLQPFDVTVTVLFLDQGIQNRTNTGVEQ